MLQLLRELGAKFGLPRFILFDNAPVGRASAALEANVESPSNPAPSTR
jgi:hypothetical protein